jgi:hypothetical protein
VIEITLDLGIHGKGDIEGFQHLSIVLWRGDPGLRKEGPIGEGLGGRQREAAHQAILERGGPGVPGFPSGRGRGHLGIHPPEGKGRHLPLLRESWFLTLRKGRGLKRFPGHNKKRGASLRGLRA